MCGGTYERETGGPAWWAANAQVERVSGGGSVSDALQTDSAAQDFAREHAIPAWIEDTLPGYQLSPNTFVTPWATNPYVTMDTTNSPSWHTWTEDCYAVTAVDSDGNGWPDWFECRLATNPYDPASRPNLNGDPDNDGWTNEQERVAVTDFFDLNDELVTGTPGAVPDAPATHEDAAIIESAIRDLQAALEDVSTATLQREQIVIMRTQLDELRNIRDALEGEEQPDLEATPVVLAEWVPFELTQDVWTSASVSVAVQADELWTVMQIKFPFGMVFWVLIGMTVSGGGCPTIPIDIGVAQTSYNICDNPLDEFMRTVMRPLMAVMMFVAFGFAAVRRVSGS
jgi:hypothetical protein